VKRFSKHPEAFGTGTIEGVIAPETANNAASTGAMLPMLTLGIPGSPTTAVMLGALVVWGLLPGPMLFIEHREFVWGLIASLYIANVLAVLINLFAIPLFTMILWLPFTILAPLIIVVCAVGGYAPTFSVFDMWLAFIFGLAGYVFRKLDYPLAPMVLALVLGNGTEVSLRQSLIMSHGSISIFFGFEGGVFSHPIAAALMWTSVALYAIPVVGAIIRYFRRRVALAKA
jgi:putative tricarboxylic transport membrane protein